MGICSAYSNRPAFEPVITHKGISPAAQLPYLIKKTNSSNYVTPAFHKFRHVQWNI